MEEVKEFFQSTQFMLFSFVLVELFFVGISMV